MEDIFIDIEEFGDLYSNESVIKSHKIAEGLRKKGVCIKKPVWENYKAS